MTQANSPANTCAVIKSLDTASWLYLQAPSRTFVCDTIGQVLPALADIQQRVDTKGGVALAVLSYEAAPAFDPSFTVIPPRTGFPLAWLAHYCSWEEIESPLERTCGPYETGHWELSLQPQPYRDSIHRIKELIASGDTYQVNFTTRMNTSFHGEPYSFFSDLYRAQPTDLCAFVDTGEFAICSGSPELFFELGAGRLRSRPMKGTAGRGLTTATDRQAGVDLSLSDKDRAENVMIVDMIRNDMGRVADVGSVVVDSLYQTERYPTVWQMVSTVSCRTGASVAEVLSALYPCASITGAPKVRTMEIIAGLENAPRGVYTGAIGLLAPGNRARFNVAIRTAVIDKSAANAEYGVGGGIVWDSTAEKEYQECQIKSRVLSSRPPDFDLLETILWEQSFGYSLLEYHLQRLAGSGEYFGYPVNAGEIKKRLSDAAEAFVDNRYRVRLLVHSDGSCVIDPVPLESPGVSSPVNVALAREPVSSQNVFLYHKTTNRGVYERARVEARDADDVLLWNERGEITESTIANVFVQMGDELLTPPVSCGLLAGTFRQKLLDTNRVKEKVITREELHLGDAVFLGNSVRGMYEVSRV